jgi:hypothetical protein
LFASEFQGGCYRSDERIAARMIRRRRATVSARLTP